MAVLNLEKISKTYGDKSILSDISLSINQNEIVGIVGPNGVGKTTLISLILGLIKEDSGTVIRGWKDYREIGVMFQEDYFLDGLKVNEVLDLHRTYYLNTKSLDDVLSVVELDHKKNTYTSKLSGGEKRRLSFAMSLINNPNFLFLDEPTNGLDVESRKSFWEKIKDLRGNQTLNIFLTSHYLEELEQICTKIIFLKKGRVELSIEMEDIHSERMLVIHDERVQEKIHQMEKVYEKDNKLYILESHINGDLETFISKYGIGQYEIKYQTLLDLYNLIYEVR